MSQKYSYWATCPKCETKFHVYGAVKKPEHTGTINGEWGAIEECLFCLGIVSRDELKTKGENDADNLHPETD